MGNKHLGYKEALNAIEAQSPGQQARLLLRLPRRGPRAKFTPQAEAEQDQLAGLRALRCTATRGLCVLPARRAGRTAQHRGAGRAGAPRSEPPSSAGEQVLLIDRKERRYLLMLEAGKEFHSHAGVVPHDAVIGSAEGTAFRSTHGHELHRDPAHARRTSCSRCPRRPGHLSRRTSAPILLLADIFPGARVLESGDRLRGAVDGDAAGRRRRSSATSCGRTSRRGPTRTCAAFLGEAALERYRVELRDCYEGIDETDLDRVVLDLPEPWQVVKHAAEALHPAGSWSAYTPQITPGRAAPRDPRGERPFGIAETIEVLHRSWHIEGQSVRPDHRMVAHTGFLTRARLLGTAR